MTEDELITRCALCARHRVDDAWTLLDEPPAQVTLVICPECLESVVTRPVPPRLLLALEVGP